MGRSGGKVVNGGELAEDLFELSVVGVGLQDGLRARSRARSRSRVAGRARWAAVRVRSAGVGHEVQLMGA